MTSSQCASSRELTPNLALEPTRYGRQRKAAPRPAGIFAVRPYAARLHGRLSSTLGLTNRRATTLHPSHFSVNEAWIVFQLNNEPIRTEGDGSFNCVALMDVASCFILGSEMVPADRGEPSKLEVRRLLKKAAAHKKQLPRTLLIAHETVGDEFALEAGRQHIEVVRVPQSELDVFVGEAQEGFRERFG